MFNFFLLFSPPLYIWKDYYDSVEHASRQKCLTLQFISLPCFTLAVLLCFIASSTRSSQIQLFSSFIIIILMLSLLCWNSKKKNSLFIYLFIYFFKWNLLNFLFLSSFLFPFLLSSFLFPFVVLLQKAGFYFATSWSMLASVTAANASDAASGGKILFAYPAIFIVGIVCIGKYQFLSLLFLFFSFSYSFSSILSFFFFSFSFFLFFFLYWYCELLTALRVKIANPDKAPMITQTHEKLKNIAQQFDGVSLSKYNEEEQLAVFEVWMDFISTFSPFSFSSSFSFW